MKLSIVIPLYNEEENVERLFHGLLPEADKLGIDYEILIVNDGSNDRSQENLAAIAREHKHVKIIEFSRNRGQTAALMAGFDYSSGEVIVTMDADNQNDPADISLLLEKINEGYGVVSGWRKERKDDFITRTLPSTIANYLISVISGVKLHDFGCTLKAYRKEVLRDTRLYGEMHRFVPIYAAWQGAKITEIIVRHHPRIGGKSKYGIMRTFNVILDLMLIRFLDRHLEKPIHLFGGFGIMNIGLAFLTFIIMLYFKFWGDKSFIRTPLPAVAILFMFMGVTSFMLGILAEILIRIYYESQDKKSYPIRQIINE